MNVKSRGILKNADAIAAEAPNGNAVNDRMLIEGAPENRAN